MTVVIKNIENTMDAAAFAYDMTKKYFSKLSTSARIIIKPNITAPKLPCTGVTTHHEVLTGMLDALTGSKNIKVVESDATSSDFEQNIHGAGYSFLKDHPNVELINLSAEPTRKVTLQGYQNTYDVELPEILFEYDILINLPVMKTHILTVVSLGIKNLFGLLPCKNKSLYHIYIHDFLFAIFKRFQPHFTILDGLVGMEGMGPIFGQPVNAKKILVSEDVVALDGIAAMLMGFDPYQIPYLNFAIDYRFGDKNLSEIDIQGDLEILNFKSISTLPIQVIRTLLTRGGHLEHILEQIDAPLQTIKNLPIFINSLISEGVIVKKNNGELHLNNANVDVLYSLFPEVKREFADIILKSCFTEYNQLVSGENP